MKDFSKKFLGIVEDNKDPDRENKCRIRVVNVFDGLAIEDLPWAVPFKDNNGEYCNLPENGKVVSVEFENGDIYNPIYRYAEHYNPNLQEKLSSLSDDDYESMKSLLFDHVTQMYSNESEGMKIDHKFNLFNITEDSINLGLKDNFGSVNIGTADASQQAILGNNFLDWFDVFVDHLLGQFGGPFFGNLLAPVVPHPGFISHILQYKALKVPKFLSHNVNFNDNGYVDNLTRVNISQRGDKWRSTTEDNNLTKENIPTGYEAKDGTKETTPDGQLTTSEELKGATVDGGINDPNKEIELPEFGEVNEDVYILVQSLINNGYVIYNEPNKMNIVGVRFQESGDQYTNKFSDKLFVFYVDNDGRWRIKNFKISTMPGTSIKITQQEYKKFTEKVDPSIIGQTISMKKYSKYVGRTGLGILQPAQYINSYRLGFFPVKGPLKTKALKSVGKQIVYRDNNWDSNRITYSFEEEGEFGMHIHRGYPGGIDVNNWSEGSQVFSNSNGLTSFINLLETHNQRYGNQFSYTLLTSQDFNTAREQINNLTDDDKDGILQNINS